MKSQPPLRVLARLLLGGVVLSATSARANAESPAPGAEAFAFDDRGFWSTTEGKPAGEGWEFDAGEIRLARPGEESGGNIVSQPLPPNFELSWEWKIGAKVNGGLKYRVRRFDDPEFGRQYLGLEYQIIDDGGDRGSIGSTASIYDLVAPASDKPLNAVGQWNEARVVAVGQRLEHYLNGTLVASADATTADWARRIALSKFYGMAGFGEPKPGDRIMLTDHGGRTTYRNFRFTPLPSPEAPAAGEKTSDGPFLTDSIEFSSVGSERAVARVRTTEGADTTSRGTAGRVRATYWPGWHRHRARVTEWTVTSAEKHYAAEWELTGLDPSTTYHVVIEATGIHGGATTDVARGSICTGSP